MRRRIGGVLFGCLMTITNDAHRLDERIYIKAAIARESQKQWDEVHRKADQIGWPLWCGNNQKER